MQAKVFGTVRPQSYLRSRTVLSEPWSCACKRLHTRKHSFHCNNDASDQLLQTATCKHCTATESASAFRHTNTASYHLAKAEIRSQTAEGRNDGSTGIVMSVDA